MTGPENPAALDIRNLQVSVVGRSGAATTVLDDVAFTVAPGSAVGLVGESGSGKTMTSLAALGLLPRNARVDRGQILLHGTDLLAKSAAQMRHIRGRQLSMVLQDPMSSLDPSFRIGSQLAESFTLHTELRGGTLRRAMVDALRRVRIPHPEQRLDQFPHQLSGGIRQRVTSAIALAGGPSVLFADEPTTALDVTTQAHYLHMLQRLQTTTGFTLVLISHDLLIVRQMCEWVVVMYAGQVVEKGRLEDVVTAPAHPYTAALFDAIPNLGHPGRLRAIEGQAPQPGRAPSGCRFAPRCQFARPRCVESPPAMTGRPGTGRTARCWGTDKDGWIDDADL